MDLSSKICYNAAHMGHCRQSNITALPPTVADDVEVQADGLAEEGNAGQHALHLALQLLCNFAQVCCAPLQMMWRSRPKASPEKVTQGAGDEIAGGSSRSRPTRLSSGCASASMAARTEPQRNLVVDLLAAVRGDSCKTWLRCGAEGVCRPAVAVLDVKVIGTCVWRIQHEKGTLLHL